MTSLGRGLPTLEEAQRELAGYAEHLNSFNRDPEDPTIPIGHVLDLLEVASAYLSRALDLQRMVHDRELNLSLPRGSVEQRWRTGGLESFIQKAKNSRDLGSRRLSFYQLLHDSEKTGRDQ